MISKLIANMVIWKSSQPRRGTLDEPEVTKEKAIFSEVLKLIHRGNQKLLVRPKHNLPTTIPCIYLLKLPVERSGA